MLIVLCSFLFVLSLAGLAYIYVGYPLILRRLARDARQERQAYMPVLDDVSQLRLSMVIVAHNEAGVLPRKLDSVLRSTIADYLLEIVVGSDGSTDETVDVIQAYPDPRVRVVAYETRRGKPAVLNDLVPTCQGDLILFADARQEFHPETLERMRARFADPQIGVVSGELVLLKDESASASAEGVGFYWRYEKLLRKLESDYRGVPGATGACYAIRRQTFRPMPMDTILDDVVLPMQVVEQGYRCCFESGAEIYDRPSSSPRQEAIRKRRTIAGAAQLLRNQPRWLLPGHNPLWFEFCSHKVMRLASPFLLMIALFTNVALVSLPWMRVFFVAQMCCYIAAGVGWLYQKSGRRSVCFGPCLMFVTLNLTTAQALWDAVRNRYQVTWSRWPQSPSMR